MLFMVVVLGVVLFVGVNLYTSYFKSYQLSESLVINSGDTTSDLITQLNNQGIEFDFYEVRLIQLLNGLGLQSGTHEITNPITMSNLLQKIDSGELLVPSVELVIPEGFSNQKIYARLERILSEDNRVNLEKFDLDEFISLSNNSEGQLFPDTYHLDVDTTAMGLYETMISNYEQKTAEFNPAITPEELIIASIVEREVPLNEDRALVADILMRRLELGMRLQVDASLDYYLDKPSSEITADELSSDHPYNTYARNGLPPTPISNPGIESLRAVRAPVSNQYLYYLSSPEGTTYYAVDLEGHKENRDLYLE